MRLSDFIRHVLNESRPHWDTPAFQQWFGKSAVTNRGQPRRVYHGAPTDIGPQFEPGHQGTDSCVFGSVKVARHGYFFAEHPEFASSFAQQGERKGLRGGNVVPVYLNIQRPLDVHEGSCKNVDAERLAAVGIDQKWIYNHLGDPRSTYEAFDEEDGAWFVERLKQAGYDGVKMAEYDPDTKREYIVWVAFEPNQIKSATGNSGRYDPTNPGLTEAVERLTVRGKPVLVYRNPTRRQAQALAEKHDEVRGTVEGSDTFLWPAAAMTHAEMAEHLHISGHETFYVAAEWASHDLDGWANPAWESGDLVVFLNTEQPGAITRIRMLFPDTVNESRPHWGTPAFQQWFGQSKVIDGTGNPLLVFRGDFPNRTSFTGGRPGDRIRGNIFFTDRPSIGRFYARNPSLRDRYRIDPETLDHTHGLYRCYLRMLNPLIVDAQGADWLAIPVPKGLSQSGTIQIDELAVIARKKGHDGLIVKDVLDQAGDGTQYIVFDPGQVRMANAAMTESFGGYSKGAHWIDPEGNLHDVPSRDDDYDHVEFHEPGYREQFVQYEDDEEREERLGDYRSEVKQEYVMAGWVRTEYTQDGGLQIEAADLKLAQRAAKMLVTDHTQRIYADIGGQYRVIEAPEFRKFLSSRTG